MDNSTTNDDLIDSLLHKFFDHTIEGPWTSAFGSVGYDPSVDFPVCRQAMEDLVAMGPAVVPRLLPLLQSRHDERTYFVVEILGRLGVREAIPKLEEFVRDYANVSTRVNFDQSIFYPIYDQALTALRLLDLSRAKSVLREIGKVDAPYGKWALEQLQQLGPDPEKETAQDHT